MYRPVSDRKAHGGERRGVDPGERDLERGEGGKMGRGRAERDAVGISKPQPGEAVTALYLTNGVFHSCIFTRNGVSRVIIPTFILAVSGVPVHATSVMLTRKTLCMTPKPGSLLMSILTKITATRPISANHPLCSASHTYRMGAGINRRITLSRKSCFSIN